ncbi:nod factor export atp-binding protein i, partial [Moniliophthora roreri]
SQFDPVYVKADSERGIRFFQVIILAQTSVPFEWPFRQETNEEQNMPPEACPDRPSLTFVDSYKRSKVIISPVPLLYLHSLSLDSQLASGLATKLSEKAVDNSRAN